MSEQPSLTVRDRTGREIRLDRSEDWGVRKLACATVHEDGSVTDAIVYGSLSVDWDADDFSALARWASVVAGAIREMTDEGEGGDGWIGDERFPPAVPDAGPERRAEEGSDG